MPKGNGDTMLSISTLRKTALQVVVWVNSEQESAFQALLTGEIRVSVVGKTGYV